MSMSMVSRAEIQAATMLRYVTFSSFTGRVTFLMMSSSSLCSNALSSSAVRSHVRALASHLASWSREMSA